MNARRASIAMLLFRVTTATASLTPYPHLPSQLPIHWNMQGQPDDWADKFHAAYLIPRILAVLLVLMFLLPRFSPRRFSIEPFVATYHDIFVIVAGLMVHIHAVMMLCGLAPEADFSRFFLCGCYLFLGLIGNVLGKVRRNRWMGIRTPWTLASDAVWIPTHRLAARLLFTAGILSIMATCAGASSTVCLAFFAVAFLIPVGESYRLYQKLKKH